MVTTQEQAWLDRSFSRQPVDRASAVKFSLLCGRNARLRAGLFRTEHEHAEFIRAGLAVRLPGVRTLK
jgi:hypothetical protein